MKKIVLFLAAALSFSVAQAQNGPRIGLKAGVNYSNLSGDLKEDRYENKIGFVGGITANFPLTSDNFLSIQPELLFSQKGYKYRDIEYKNAMNQTIKNKGEVSYNYLDLPILLRVNAGGLFFEGGPQVSYLLGIKDNTEVSVDGDTFRETSTKIDKDNLAEIEIGYAAGIGYQTGNGLSLGLRYNGSINSLAKNDGDELANARHSVFQLTLGFMIPRK
ncbi:porin family protein [Rufibacter roseus]|uniref:Porin family protein n=1 Tax=Rufibacter roseus TaxID=1567108 RepID=A0ABW2DHF1_9BACT|nr:porin family protein [Rufibacter roseus]